MKYLKQFGIIVFISFVGELLNMIIPLPVPASIYGMLILFVGLQTGLIRLSWVKETGKFLIAIMPVMFIPSAVGLVDIWGIMKSIWIQIVIIMVVSTIVVMVVSGKLTQIIIRAEKKGKSHERNSH